MIFRLAHLSDAHIGPLPKAQWRELVGKRLTGYMNWHNGRHNIHNMDVLRELVLDIQAQAPDHIAMTGDILNIGLEAEFPLAKAWLASVGTPEQVSFVPGNHDAYVHSNLADIARFFGDWMGPGAGFPYVRKRGAVALIGLNSGVPTLPLVASGRLGKAQIAKLREVLSDTNLRDMARVILIHHPPYSTGARAFRGLEDARAFERVIAECGAELVLHGHNHRQQVHFLKSAKPVPVVGVASASAVPGSPHHLAAYHLFEISQGEQGWQVSGRCRGSRNDLGGLHDLGAINLHR